MWLILLYRKKRGGREKRVKGAISYKVEEGRNEGRKVFELLSCICLSGHETESGGGEIWRVVEEKMRGEPEGGRGERWKERGREREGW